MLHNIMTVGRSNVNMMRMYLYFLQWLIILVSSSRGEGDVSSVEHPECRLYLAESTIPGGELHSVFAYFCIWGMYDNTIYLFARNISHVLS